MKNQTGCPPPLNEISAFGRQLKNLIRAGVVGDFLLIQINYEQRLKNVATNHFFCCTFQLPTLLIETTKAKQEQKASSSAFHES